MKMQSFLAKIPIAISFLLDSPANMLTKEDGKTGIFYRTIKINNFLKNFA